MKKLKRLVLILGGKGGTGKTASISLLFYFLVKSGIKVKGFDADVENPLFFETHESTAHKVAELDLLAIDAARDFLNTLNQLGDHRPEVLLIDMPGASGYQTRELIDKFHLFKAAELLGYRLTICAVLNTEPAAINSLHAMMEPYGDQVDYVVIKNQIWTQGGKDFSLWEKSSTRNLFKQFNGIEIELPVLEPVVFQELRAKNRSFFAIESLGFADQLLAESFLGLSQLELNKAATYLGLPSPDTASSNNGSVPAKAASTKARRSTGSAKSAAVAQTEETSHDSGGK